MTKEPDADKLNEVLSRLSQENAAWRTKVDNTLVLIRQRAPNVDGLSLEAAIKTLIDEREQAQERIHFFRNELKEILNFLLSSDLDDSKKSNELRKRINLFLFKNPK